MNKTENDFRTRDLYRASFLMARGLKLIRVEKTGSIATFIFENKDRIDEMVTSFYNNSEQVDANKLICAIRDLKSLVHNL
jgi:hypothetical protein